MIFTIIGLVLDVLGVILLFIYGLPSKEIYKTILQDNRLSEKREKQIIFRSKVGLGFLILGFVLQIFGTIIQNCV